MTEAQVRQKLVGVMRGWVGRKESDGSHREIIDIYNSHTPLARNYKVQYTDAWCATTVSAAAIVAGLTDIIPTECSCTRQIALFQGLGRWMENDAYSPKPGDIIYYDWQDNGKGDNAGAPDHVGVVECVNGSVITVIEGNYSDAVKRRNIAVNGRYIRGFGIPDYKSKASTTTPKNLMVGDTVRFTGNRQYVNSYEDASSVSARACDAKITLIREGGAHPYHLTGLGVEGWVNAIDMDTAQYTVEVTGRPHLNIRVKPGTEYNKIGYLNPSDKVCIVGEQSGWGELEDGGWIKLEFTKRV